MTRWWGWWQPVDTKPSKRSLRRDVIRLENERAEAARRYERMERRNDQLEVANEGLRIEVKQVTRAFREAQAQAAAADQAAEGLGQRIAEARRILAGAGHAADRIAAALRALEGGGDGG